MSLQTILSDWSAPRSAPAFTGYSGNPACDGAGGPSGTLLLCVANTSIPCTDKGMELQKFVQFTVLNVRKKGWSYAPWKKPTNKNAKTVRDENAKELFENGEWARNDVTMERVGQSVHMYSFVKDGLSKGERLDSCVSVIAAGQTFRVRLQGFMYEEKKARVFPQDVESIPAFSVIEIMITSANQNGFEQGYGLQLARVRPCEFSLYSMQNPLGLGLLPSTYEASLQRAEVWRGNNPGLNRVLEEKNTAFFGRVTKGAYLVKYSEDLFRLVGPKENPADPQSKHLNVMEGGVFAIDFTHADLLRFTNSGEEEKEDGLVYANFVVELAAAAGALDCYVVYNEYLLRDDPNRSPFTGVPLVDTQALLECVKDITGVVGQRFPLPFDFSPLERPYLMLEPVEENADAAEETRPCDDMVLASENTRVWKRSYMLSVGDATEEDIMRFLFVPKSAAAKGKSSLAGRQDYRLLKRPKTRVEASV